MYTHTCIYIYYLIHIHVYIYVYTYITKKKIILKIMIKIIRKLGMGNI